ncbi:hypothetical protein [Flavobacterium sp.]|uniref:hypothetical protein n=1 Tax=Flavobacterium sp. TaxID=239 RepID=UPI003D13EFC7
MKDQKLDSPSFDFTEKIMSQIAVSNSSPETVYKPLISKSVFVGIIGILIALVGCSLLYGNQTNERFVYFDFSVFYNNSLMGVFHMSKTASYSILLTTLFFWVQISFLKNHFDKKFEV